MDKILYGGFQRSAEGRMRRFSKLLQAVLAVYMAYVPFAMAADLNSLENTILPSDEMATAAAGRWLWFAANSYNAAWLVQTGEARVKLEKNKLDAEFFLGGELQYSIHGSMKPIAGVKSAISDMRIRKWSVVATVAPIGDYEWEMRGTYVLREYLGKGPGKHWKTEQSLIVSDEALALGVSRYTQ